LAVTAGRQWTDFKAALDDWWADGLITKGLAALLLLYSIIALLLALLWSRQAPLFDVRAEAAYLLAEESREPVVGATLSATLINVGEYLLEKPGGFLSNDIAPPGVLLDNTPNWEFGALVQLRDLARAMRENFSRSQTQSVEDLELAIAETRLHIDHRSWILPRSESEYREGLTYSRAYLRRLADPQQSTAQFYARADNLAVWLATVETRLGSLSQRLSASVGQRRLNTDLAGEAKAVQATQSAAEIEVKTPWRAVDDVFYQARGSTWALIHFLKAAEIDFAEVLERKNARVSLQQIIRELEATQQVVWSPVILNGSGFGIFANHSLVMASYIARANAAIIDLRELLSQG